MAKPRISDRSLRYAITVGETSAEKVRQHLRQQAGNDLCWAAEAAFIDRREPSYLPEQSRYKFLDPGGLVPLPLPFSSAISLDSNVVLDLEKAAQRKVPESLHQELQGLVRNLWHQDIRPAFALTELCWNGRVGEYRLDREASLSAAIDAWFDDRSLGSLEPDRLHKRWEQRLKYHTDRNSHLEEYDLRPLVSSLYCCLLKLATLLLTIDGFKANQRVALLTEYCQWVNDEFGFVLAYPLQIAQDSLVGKPSESGYTRKLLKFSKNTLRDLWGAAWDLAILSLTTDLVASGKGYDPIGLRDAVLVTADKGLVELRARLAYHGILQHSSHDDDWRILVASRLSLDKRLESQSASIGRIMSSLQEGAEMRLNKLGETKSLSQIEREIEELETIVLSLTASNSQEPEDGVQIARANRPSWWKRTFGRAGK